MTDDLPEFLGESPGIMALREKVARLLHNQSDGRRLPPVFVQGENGTGKTVLARSLHRASARRDGPFVDVNASAVSESLAEREMFGVERGAYTDARETKPGLFQAAHKGTLFLDEIGLMSAGLQSALLKAIEEKTVRRVGSTRTEAVDVWVITASNEDLAAAIRERRFREDLYFRLTRVVLRVPPLRERGNDILLLAEHVLKRVCREQGLPRRLDPEACGALLAYHWPGNVRELENVIERAALFAETEVITPRELELPSARHPLSQVEPPAVKAQQDRIERERILQIWRETDGNLTRAAQRLGMKRNTLRYWLEKFGLLTSSAKRPAKRETQTWESRRLGLVRAEVGPTAGQWLDTMITKFEAFGGRILNRNSTGLTAAFGAAPVEDAPGRAAHTATAVLRAAERARAEGQDVHVALAVDVRRCQLGFTSGIPVLDPSAEREVATRLGALEACAQPDTVVASEAAAAFLERRFELTQIEAPAGAGFAVYRIVAPGRSGLGPGRRVSTFVGRQHDIEVLKDHLAMVSRGQGRAIGIVGDAGIGKSRLVSEFRRSLDSQRVIFLEGACFSHTSAIPYVPVLAILRQSCGIGESDTAEVVASHLRTRLESMEMNVEESVPYLIQLLGLREGTERLAQLTSEAIRLRTLEILRQMILGASAQRPVVVVLEDVHWVDRASEEIFSSVATGLPGAPVLFVSTYRPGFHPSWMKRSFATQLSLSPLSPEDSRTMLGSVLEEEVPESVSQMILDKAEGNPFFLEEVYRTVAGQRNPGIVAAVPDTIEEVLLARIERLTEEPKSVLQTAAVLGREFPWEVLEAVWRGSGSLEAHAALLTDHEFLYQRTGRRERVYVFKHALTQQVTYASLTPARQRELHATAGRALERLFADRLEEAYDRLANHYARTEEAEKAVEYLDGLASKAARSDAHEEAVHAWKDALQHVERVPPDIRDHRRLELLLALSGSLLPLGRLGEIRALLLPEDERLERLRDPSLTARYHFILARVNMLGNHALVADNARRAIAEAERCGDQATMGGAYGVLAVACALSGQAARGIECGQRAVALLEKTDSRRWLSYAYWALGLCCSQTSRFAEAVAAEAQSLAIAQAIGDAVLEVSARWGAGIARAAVGEWDEGIADCLRAVQVARDVLYRALATAFLGFAYVEKGDADQAIAALEQAIPLVQRFGLRAYEGWFTAFLAEAHRLAGHLERAQALSTSAHQIATEANFPVAVGWAQLSLGRIAAARHDLAAATARLQEAIATFTTTTSRYECARAHLDLAGVAQAGSDSEVARQHLVTAHGLFRELDVPRYCERVERVAADWGLSL